MEERSIQQIVLTVDILALLPGHHLIGDHSLSRAELRMVSEEFFSRPDASRLDQRGCHREPAEIHDPDCEPDSFTWSRR